LIRKKLLVEGDVQGVGYRAACLREALRIGKLYGWVCNLPNGVVEVVMQGDPIAVAKLIHWCREGPPAAEVEKITELPLSNEENMDSEFFTFKIKQF